MYESHIFRIEMMEPHSSMDPDLWTLDAHCDTVYMRVFLQGEGLPQELRGIDPDTFFRVTLPRLREGQVRCLFVNVGDIGLLTSSAIVDYLNMWAEEEGGEVSICRNAADVNRTIGSGRLALVMACEGAFLFLERLDLLRNWHRLGVRVVTLTHGEGQEGLSWFAKIALEKDALIKAGSSFALQGTPSRDEYMEPGVREELRKKEKGLTSFGRSAVEEMIRLGMVCDLSHANDATFWDAMDLARETGKGKFCCTHSNCAALCSHTRNLTDAMMEALADRDGVMGICYYGEFIDEHHPSLERYVGHVLHALDVMGPDHVGIGSDYDGVPPGAFMAIPHPGHTGALWTALADAGVPAATLRNIAHNNFLRLL
jgi:membrane dipeptidase